MKNYFYLTLFFLLIGTTQNIKAQTCDEMIQAAKKEETKGEYFKAYQKYEAALNNCGEARKTEIIKLRDNAILSLQNLKNEAVREKEKAKKAQKATVEALTKVETQKEMAQTNLEKANKLVNAFYFYDGRFALAFKDYRFYFIDKEGNEVKKLGKWDKAEQFEENGNGFTKVWSGKTEHYLDTLGNTYRVAYALEDLSPEIKALDLTGTHLDYFPTEVLTHSQLEVLILNGGYYMLNNFSTLPTEIAKLSNLKVLQLENCKINSLPTEIGKLTNLQTLNLRYNKLTQLPTEIGKLTNLQMLDLDKNQLTKLPAEIGKLTNLQTLDLRSNELTQLPTEIGELAKLQRLDLGSNQLTQFPAEVGKLITLQKLDLSCNRLTKLPAEIGKLTNLQKLYLSANRLTQLPTEIGTLINLRTLGLSGNQLTQLPTKIGTLINLQELNLSHNQLTQLPPEIGELTNLQRLYLTPNRLTQLPTEIGTLINLQMLGLNGNPISDEEQEKILKLLPNCLILF